MLTIHVIGMGPGNPDLLTGRARKALAEATIVVGDTRLLRDEVKKGKTVVQTYKADEIRDIAAHADRKKTALPSSFRVMWVFSAYLNLSAIFPIAG